MDNHEEPMMPEAVETPPRPRHNRKPAIIALIAIAAVIAVGLGPKVAQNRRLRDESVELQRQPPAVTVVNLTQSASATDLTLPCNIQPIDQTTINARTSGYVSQRLVDIGSHVVKGQLLAVVESPELDQQLSQTVAETAKAQAGLGSALSDSAKQLAAISAAQADQSRAEAAQSQAQADLAHLRAKQMQANSAVNVAKSRETEISKRHAAAVADLARAHSQLTLAAKTLARWKELEKAEAVAGQDVDEKQAAWESAQAVVEAAEATVSSTQAADEAAKNDIEAARNEVQAAAADVQSGLGRIRAAVAAVTSSKANVVAARAAYRASQSGVQSASATISSDEANGRRVGALQSFERITAPFSGVITARNVDVGDLVNSSSSGTGASDQTSAVTRTGLFGLAKTDVLRAQIDVPEDSATLMHVGQAAEVTVDEIPKRVFKGTVFNVSGALDTTSRTLLVEVRVPNFDGALKPGMYSRVTFLHSKGASVLWLPANALIFNANGTQVATVTDAGTMHYVKVKLGRDLGDRIEVLGGLTGTQQVIANADDSIPEGTKVHPIPEAGS